MNRLVIVASLFALAAPTALAVPPSGQGKPESTAVSTPSAAELCKQQRRMIGMKAFRELYAPNGTPKAALEACLTKQVQTAASAAKNAAMECKAERADSDGFAADPAHGGNARRAPQMGAGTRSRHGCPPRHRGRCGHAAHRSGSRQEHPGPLPVPAAKLGQAVAGLPGSGCGSLIFPTSAALWSR